MPKDKKSKSKAKMRKFDLDYFGLVTFSRYNGAGFEKFMYTDDKKAPSGDKKKSKAKEVVVPKLPMLPEPQDPRKHTKSKKRVEKQTFRPDIYVPMTSVNKGHLEKTTRMIRPRKEGSINDVACGPNYPILPRPMPHGGVYGDPRCSLCATQGGLTKTLFGMLHKKMRSLINNQFDKVEYLLAWLLERVMDAKNLQEAYLTQVKEEMGPSLDELDSNE